MADVEVMNWQEFVEAIAVSGDTVILPDGERWDMNEIAPEGITEGITVKCAKIVGNGTSIWNGRFYEPFQVDGTEISDLHLINYYSDSAMISGTGKYERCMISGLSSARVALPLTGTSWNRCSFNVEVQSTGGAWAVSGSCTFCRIILHAANATGTTVQARNAAKTNCEIILYMPQATIIYLENLQYCTVRGNMHSCGTIGRYATEHTSLYPIVNTDDLADGANVKSNLIGVTDAQMQDAAYLASVGFPIGGDES